MEKDKPPYQQIDGWLIFIVFLLAGASILAIYSAQPSLPANIQNVNFAGKQLTWYAIGTVAVICTLIIDFDRFKLISWYLYGLGILMLIGLPVLEPFTDIVRPINGAVSWYSIPKLGNIQPSELMKIFLIIVLSQIIVQHNKAYPVRTIREDLLLLGKIFAASIVPLVLVFTQPDFGTAMVFSAIIIFLLIVSGIKWRLLFGLFTGFSLFGAFLFYIYITFPAFFKEYILQEYQLRRFYGWLSPHDNPDWGFQLLRSLLAIGSGQLDGKGFMQGQVYMPEAHTDFIFAVIGEQFGFIGASIVISLFFLLVYRMIHTALESHDPFGSYLCAGVIGMITFQVFQNIGMTIQLMPITGIPLPFVSYGGSSLLTYMIAVGIVLNVRSRTKKFMFGN